MSSIKQREKFDEFKMEDEYDFSDGVRGRFFSLRLDNNIVLFFKKLASEKKYLTKLS